MPVKSRQVYERRLGGLKLERESFINHWRELSDYLLPKRGRFLVTDRNKGDQHPWNKIINNTASIAQRVMSAGLMAGITSPSRPWFRLATPDPDLMDYPGVRAWLHTVEERMRDVFARSNFYNALHTVYVELSTFGTSCMSIMEDSDDVIHCAVYTAGEYFLGQNDKGIIDTLYREFEMQTHQLVSKFGIENCPQAVKADFENGTTESWWKVVHVIEPNDDRIEGYADFRNMPFRSVYFVCGDVKDGSEDDGFLRISGFNEFPVVAPRWNVAGGDIYGTDCPGMMVLGDVKQLQVQENFKAMAIEKIVSPPMVAPSGLEARNIVGYPGGVTYYDTTQSGPQAIRPLFEINPQIVQVAVQATEEVMYRIRRAYMEDIFLMMAQTDRREITAREVDERHEEKLLQLGPMVERFHSEALKQIIDRTFAVMQRGGYLPPAPEPLMETDLKVEFISMLAQAQKLVSIGGIERLAMFVGQIAAIKPDVVDKWNAEESIEQYADVLGVSPDQLRTDDELEQIRRAAAEQQQQMMALQSAAEGAKAAKALGETQVQGESALDRVLNMGAGR